ncbi:MAG: hypothetical protein J0M30_02805 [Chitinophagales bacterium]|nr:hypothetical protein [Chitinophagales bacterium]
MRYALFIIILCLFACRVGKENEKIQICIKIVSDEVSTKTSFDEIYLGSAMDGRIISIDGFFSFGFEDIALYPEKDDHSKKGLWLIFNREVMAKDSLLKKLNGRKVNITGKVDLLNKGHLNYYYGTISNVTCIQQIN